MKKVFFFATLISLLLFLSKCDKNNDIFSTKTLPQPYNSEILSKLYDQLPTIDYEGVSVVGDGILRFRSLELYDTIFAQLEQNCAIWDSLFYDSYSYLSDDSLDSFEDSINYHEFLPLIVFENRFGLSNSSLRQKVENDFNIWLGRDMSGDIPSDPFILDEVEQSFYNQHHEICIGDTIYSIRKEGEVLIPLDSIRQISNYRLMSFDELSEIFNVVTKGWDGTIEFMYIPASTSEIVYYSSTDRTIYEVNASCPYIHNDTYKPKMVCKITNYHFKNNKWDKKRKYCSIYASVYFYWQRVHPNTGLLTDNGLTDKLTKEKSTKKRLSRKITIKGEVEEEQGLYNFGVKKYPTLEFTVAGVSTTKNIVFNNN